MFIPDQLSFILLTIAFTIAFGLFYGYLHLSVTAKLAHIASVLSRMEAKHDSSDELLRLVHERVSNLNGMLAEHAVLTHTENAAIVQAIQAVDACKPDLTNLATPLYQVRDIVEAFKNDLITQVRLSREDYEELMTAAESKGELLPQQLNDLRLALGTLQAQLADFRIEFHQITGS